MLGGKRRSTKKCVSKSKAQCRSAKRKCKFSTKTKRCGSRKSRRKSRKSKKSKKSKKKSRKSIRCGARKKSKTCKSAKKTCKWSAKNGCSSRKKKSRRKSRKRCSSKTEKQCRKSSRKCNYNEDTKKCRTNPKKKKLPLCPWNAKKDKCLKGKRSEHCVVLDQGEKRCARKVLEQLTSLDTEQDALKQVLETENMDFDSLSDDVIDKLSDMLQEEDKNLSRNDRKQKLLDLIKKNADDSSEDSSDNDVDAQLRNDFDIYDLPNMNDKDVAERFLDEMNETFTDDTYVLSFLRDYLGKNGKKPFGSKSELEERFVDLVTEQNHKFDKKILLDFLIKEKAKSLN